MPLFQIMCIQNLRHSRIKGQTIKMWEIRDQIFWWFCFPINCVCGWLANRSCLKFTAGKISWLLSKGCCSEKTTWSCLKYLGSDYKSLAEQSCFSLGFHCARFSHHKYALKQDCDDLHVNSASGQAASCPHCILTWGCQWRSGGKYCAHWCRDSGTEEERQPPLFFPPGPGSPTWDFGDLCKLNSWCQSK